MIRQQWQTLLDIYSIIMLWVEASSFPSLFTAKAATSGSEPTGRAAILKAMADRKKQERLDKERSRKKKDLMDQWVTFCFACIFQTYVVLPLGPTWNGGGAVSVC